MCEVAQCQYIDTEEQWGSWGIAIKNAEVGITPQSKVAMFSVVNSVAHELSQLLFLHMSNFLLGYKLLTGRDLPIIYLSAQYSSQGKAAPISDHVVSTSKSLKSISSVSVWWCTSQSHHLLPRLQYPASQASQIHSLFSNKSDFSKTTVIILLFY